MSRMLLLGAAIFYALAADPARAAPAAEAGPAPGTIAWVWPADEAPSPRFGEWAVMVEQLRLQTGKVERYPRQRRLLVPEGVRITPVVHVDVPRRADFLLEPAHREAIARALRQAARLSTSGLVQLDFEPPDRLRDTYAAWLPVFVDQLSPTIRLSVTVRVGWCDEPLWLQALPVAEVVPMFFRMGELTNRYRERLLKTPGSLAARCTGGSAGFAAAEPLPEAAMARFARRYWFGVDSGFKQPPFKQTQP